MLNDVAVIGSGPAGIAASIYLKRAGYEPLVFERREIGGLLLNANLVENYPGFTGGISGEELVNRFVAQLEEQNIGITMSEVKRVELKDYGFDILTDNGKKSARCVIIATGTAPKNVDIPGVGKFFGKKIFYEVRDVPQSRKGKNFAIVGGGDAAFDYALNLAAEDCNVDIMFRTESPRCIPLLERRAKEKTNIRILAWTELVSVTEGNDILSLECNSSGKLTNISADFLLLACGRRSNIDFLSVNLQQSIDENGRVPGLFLAGDVKRGDFRQVGIAVGDGILSAMAAVEFLKKEGADARTR